jgi:cysteine desulfurase / selenocysteine lyase
MRSAGASRKAPPQYGMALRPALGSRALFPDLEARAYLAHAAVSPLSRPVQEAVAELLRSYGRGGLATSIAQAEVRERLRKNLGALLGAPPEQIGLVQSTSWAATIVARSLGLGQGQRVLGFRGEFPANVLPFKHAAEEAGAGLELLPLAPFERSTEEGLALLEAELARAPVRLVAVSAVQFQTGFAMPVGDIARVCHRHGAELFVDVIQGLGALPFDALALDVDYAAASGHKFLMGPEGTGFLYAHPRALARLTRGFAGWNTVEQAFRFLMDGPGHLVYDAAPLARTAFVEQGAQNALGHAALLASTSILLTLGVPAIAAHVGAYLDALEAGLVARGCTSVRSPRLEARSASLCVRLPADAPSLREVAQHLAGSGIAVSTPDGHLRFAPHFSNALDEVPAVLAAFDGALASHTSADVG